MRGGRSLIHDITKEGHCNAHSHHVTYVARGDDTRKVVLFSLSG